MGEDGNAWDWRPPIFGCTLANAVYIHGNYQFPSTDIISSEFYDGDEHSINDAPFDRGKPQVVQSTLNFMSAATLR
jgi:hypothetical protein